MGNIVKRIKMFVEYLGISVRQFEIEVGVSNATLSKPFGTGKGTSTDTLEKIFARYEELNPVWAIRGKGSMILSIKEQEVLSELQENNVAFGFDVSQKKDLKDIIDDSLKNYKQELIDTKRVLELEKELEELNKQLDEQKKNSASN